MTGSECNVPQVADIWGKGTHDARPGELESLLSSEIHGALARLVQAAILTQAVCKLPWPAEVDVEKTKQKIREARDVVEELQREVTT